MIRVKRIYAEAGKEDGFRILVDRLWPRGVSKEKARLDVWFKEIAPSDSLREWFGHDPKKWTAFQEKYVAEIRENRENLEKLREIVRKNTNNTLLYAAKDEEHNEAIVLQRFLQAKVKKIKSKIRV